MCPEEREMGKLLGYQRALWRRPMHSGLPLDESEVFCIKVDLANPND